MGIFAFDPVTVSEQHQRSEAVWLFDRIFRQPATKDILPEENLTSEVIAFFLDHCAPLKAAFLCKIGLGAEISVWTVETQKRLYEQGQAWHNMIPDIVLTSGDGRCMVLIEVKIDAGPTLDKQGNPQTLAYSKYLSSQKERGLCAETRMVALTRWRLDESFCENCNYVFRFNDLLAWIKEAVSEPDCNPALSLMAFQWGEYIEHRRWNMKPITQEHLEAIPKITELVTRIWEVLDAARALVKADDNRWQDKPGRSSVGQLPGQGRKGEIAWIRPIGKQDISGSVQLGCFYGEENRRIVIRPVILASKLYLNSLPLEIPFILESSPWSEDAKLILLKDVAPEVGKIEVWDHMRDDLINALKYIR